MIDKPDLLLLALPWWDNYIPHCGPAVLKGIAETHGYSIKVVDGSTLLEQDICQSNRERFLANRKYFLAKDDQSSEVCDMYTQLLEKINEYQPRMVGISVFSTYTHRASYDLVRLIRQQFPDITIVIGGGGIDLKPHVSIEDELTPAEHMITFEQLLRKRKLADLFAVGDAEDTILDILSNNSTDDLFHQPANRTLDYPFSDFSDLNLNHYHGSYGTKTLPVVSSKGCVRKCDFCEIPATSKYKVKDGVRLAQEMIHLQQSTSEKVEFSFADSIVNGSIKQLTSMCNYLAEHNSQASDDMKITWSGNWICRSQGYIDKNFYKTLALSGAGAMSVGAEHGSNRVLEAMCKKSTVEGLFYELEEFRKNGIKCSLNNISGHWSEMYDDFILHLDMLLKLGPYLATETVLQLSLNVFTALRDTPVTDPKNYDTHGIHSEESNATEMWYSVKNPNLTLKHRLSRYFILLTFVKNYNIRMMGLKLPAVMTLNQKHEIFFERWEQYFDDHVIRESYFPCPSLNYLDNPMRLIKERMEVLYPTMHVKLSLTASHVNGPPIVHILHNGLEVYTQALTEGLNDIVLELPNDFSVDTNSLTIKMTNKGQFDTIVGEDGRIQKDKFIEFDSIVIDKAELLANNHYFLFNTEYFIDGTKTDTMYGLYSNNSELKLVYTVPFWTDMVRVNSNRARDLDHSHALSEGMETLRKNIKEMKL